MKIFSNYPAEVLTLLFLIVTFLQSGIDKLTDWNGNLSFIKGHFKNSPLKNAVPLLLAIILIVEMAASVFMLLGVYQLYTSEIKEMAALGSRTFCCELNLSFNRTASCKRLCRSNDPSGLLYHLPFWVVSAK